MVLHLHTGAFEVTPALQRFAEQQLDAHLGRFHGVIQTVTVRVDDLNGGEKGGLDKRCGVTVALPRHRRIHVQDTDADAYTALARALSKAGRALERLADRWTARREARAARLVGEEKE